MEYAVLCILIALLQYIFFTGKTGFYRNKYGVEAPHVTGHEVWERIFRVQQNTLEQLVVYIPAMLAFAYYISELWVLVPGILFIIGRQIYSHTYVKSPQTRAPGAALSLLSNITLLIGAIIGLIMRIS